MSAPDHNDAFAAELEAEDTAKADQRLAGWRRRTAEVMDVPCPSCHGMGYVTRTMEAEGTTDRALLEKLLTAVAHHKLVVGQAHAEDADLSLWVTATAIAEEVAR